MKRDARKHVLVDANVLAAYLATKSHKSAVVHDRARVLLDAALWHGWPVVQVYVPSVCVAETQCVLDRHRYCDWYGSSKDPLYRLTKREYTSALRHLDAFLVNRNLIQIELDAQHIRAASLVSVVNSKYQYRRRSRGSGRKPNGRRIKGPMGAADCVIAGMAIDLAFRIGVDDISVVTGDRRLADVVAVCRKLTTARAKNLGLPDLAKRVGVSWSRHIYPQAINLATAQDSDLAGCSGGWPLPACAIVEKLIDELDESEKQSLYRLGLETKRQTGVGPDSLPYTDELDFLQTKFGVQTGVYLTRASIARQLLAWRKNPRSRPE